MMVDRSRETMGATFTTFGPIHFAILSAIPVCGGVLAVVERRVSTRHRVLRLLLAVALLLDSIGWYLYLAAHGWLIFPDSLPLQLCDVTLYLMILVLLTRNAAAFDLAYYGALAGTSMALLTPDLDEHSLSLSTIHFFLTHGLVVASALYLVWSKQARPRPGSVWRAMVAVNIFAAITGTFDFAFHTNYMYLRTKPQNLSLLDVLGPWPWYIATSELIALGLFTLLYLPFWQRTSKPEAFTGISSAA